VESDQNLYLTLRTFDTILTMPKKCVTISLFIKFYPLYSDGKFDIIAKKFWNRFMIKLKDTIHFSFLTLLLLWLSGCSSHQKTLSKNDQCIVDAMNAPLWVCKPRVVDGYAGLGAVEKNSTDMLKMENAALKVAKSEIAKQMQTEIKNRVDKLNLTSNNTNIDNKDEISALLKSISKEISKSNLNLSKEVKIWTSASGKLYLLASVQKSNFDEEIKKAVLSSYKKDKNVWISYLSTQSLDEFEKEFALTIPKNVASETKALRVETIANSRVGLNIKNKKNN
jgi:hypothetical protein